MTTASTANYMRSAGIVGIAASVSVPAVTTTMTLAVTQDAPNLSQVLIAGACGTVVGVTLGICILRHHCRLLTNRNH
ncbi:MAG: hypothetical protein WBB28_28180 [Crinalium sp.]